MSIIKQVLNQDAFWMLNKSIAKEVGLDSALLLSELIGREIYMTNKLEIDGEEYFQATSDSLEDATTLSYKIQKRCIRDLKKVEFIKTKLKGIPAKLHFTICSDKIENFIRTSSDLRANLLYNNNSIKIDYKKEEREKNQNFDKNGQTEMFESKIPKGNHLFKNSPFSDFSKFEKKFSKEAELGIDLKFYFGAVSDWSESSGKMKKDWISTARQFMRRDKQENKLVLLTGNKNIKSDEESMRNFFNQG